MTEKLKEEIKEVSVQDLLVKIHKLEIFVKRAERRIASHERKLDGLKKDLKNEIKNLKKRLTA